MGMPAGEDRIYLRTSHGRQHRHGSGSSEYHSSVPSSAAADYNNVPPPSLPVLPYSVHVTA